jgi:asparagine synthase (glutamine-hydrolysing)
VHVLDPTQALELRSRSAMTLHAAPDWRVPPAFSSMPEAVEAMAALIARDFASMLGAFGTKIGMALSGGFDSRLLLAALDHAGVRPSLYVYGRPEDDDVRIALAKAAALGMPIEAVDKRQLNAQQAPLDRARLADSLAFFDGLPIDGVFDRGADRITRLQQVQDGTLNLNGGGGEILRNFFYLPERSYTADDLVGTFYSNWLPQAFPTADEHAAFRQATAAGILHELGFDGGSAAARARRLDRSDVELVYTLFRLRHWMGRNNTVAARYGAFMTPLVQPRMVALAATVPLQWKTHGDLEAAIIRTLSPRVAQGPSNYGFDFATGPTPAYRRHILATLYRPVEVRRRSARIRRLLGRNASVGAPTEWTAAFTTGPVDWIDARFLTDAAQVNRLMTLCALLDDDLVAPASPR